jgi:hypothetical protein
MGRCLRSCSNRKLGRRTIEGIAALRE